jgi:hypothetical protein
MNLEQQLYHIRSHLEELHAQNRAELQDEIIDTEAEIMRLEAVKYSEAIQSQLTSQSPPLDNPGE